MSRLRWPEAVLAAVGVLVATWPLTNLIESDSWVASVTVLVACVAALGCAGRALRLPVWAIAAGQICMVLLITAALRLSDVLAPTQWGELSGAVQELLRDANKTLTTYAAPAPLSPGVLFLLTLCIPLVAVVVDLLSASLRMPAVAGMPLLAVFLFSTSNTGDALNPVHFLALGAIWLGMLLQQALRTLRDWGSTEAYARTPERADDRLGLGAFSATARWLGALTLALAVALPIVIPHLPTQYLADGLARRQEANTASVGFTDTLNLSRDLNDRDQTPILTYATTDAAPPPLKVLTMSSYSGGTWQREDPTRRVEGEDDRKLPSPSGLSPRTERTLERINVVGNGLDLPYLAAPWPVDNADLKGRPWYFDPDSGLPRARGTTPEYTITYENLDAEARPTGSPEDFSSLPSSTLGVPDQARAEVERATRSVKAGLDTDDPFEKAIGIQDWLRDPDRFTYSLSLAGRRTGSDGQPLDPLSNFLVTRRGYCTQFATAMAMMARSEGIPARVAVGFLPGTQTGSGSYQVRAADAHAWPELYFPGLGWTRFEPTPGVRSGDVPSYTLPQADGATTRATQGRNEDNDQSATSSAPSASTSSAPAPSAQPITRSEGSSLQAPWVWWTLLALVLGGLGAAILPLAARRRRERIRQAASVPREEIEAQWSGLEMQLRDLGVDGPGERSPRQLEQFYRRRAPLEAGGKEALHRATQTLERARYAPPDASSPSIGEDVDQIVREVRDQASLPTRVAAMFFPRTGREAIAGAARRLLGSPARALRRLTRRGD